MASQTHLPNSHRKYDIEVDGITITAHIPPKRLGSTARDVTNWTRNGGKSKDDPFVIDDNDEIQGIYETSFSRPGTSSQTAKSPDLVVSTTPAFLSTVCLRCHFRIRLSVSRHPKPRIRALKFYATLAQALQQSLVHAKITPKPYHIPLLEAQRLFLRLCSDKQAEHRLGPFSRPHRAFPARGKTQNHQI